MAAGRHGAAPDRHPAHPSLDARFHEPAPVEAERSTTALALPELRQEEHSPHDRDGQTDGKNGPTHQRRVARRLFRGWRLCCCLLRCAYRAALAEFALHGVGPN
jgi:hypothetical protein